MKELPDVAAKLFTNEYRAVKLKGMKARRKDPGTGSVQSVNFVTVLPAASHGKLSSSCVCSVLTPPILSWCIDWPP